MSLSKRQLEVLQMMAASEAAEDFEDAEIVQEGIECWLGTTRVSPRTVKALLEHVCVSTDGDKSFRRFSINGVGRLVARKPELADQIWLAVQRGKRINVTEDGFEEMSQ